MILRTAEPAPIQLTREIPIDQVDQHRVADCALYDSCLDRAVRGGWESWSCAGCPVGGLPIALLPPTRQEEDDATRTQKVLDALRERGEMRRREIGEVIGDPGHASNVVSRLIARGLVRRVALGVYALEEVPRTKEPGPRHDSIRGRVLQVIESSDRTWRPGELDTALGATRHQVTQALGDLAAENVIRRLARGVYAKREG